MPEVIMLVCDRYGSSLMVNNTAALSSAIKDHHRNATASLREAMRISGVSESNLWEEMPIFVEGDRIGFTFASCDIVTNKIGELARSVATAMLRAQSNTTVAIASGNIELAYSSDTEDPFKLAFHIGKVVTDLDSALERCPAGRVLSAQNFPTLCELTGVSGHYWSGEGLTESEIFDEPIVRSGLLNLYAALTNLGSSALPLLTRAIDGSYRGVETPMSQIYFLTKCLAALELDKKQRRAKFKNTFDEKLGGLAELTPLRDFMKQVDDEFSNVFTSVFRLSQTFLDGSTPYIEAKKLVMLLSQFKDPPFSNLPKPDEGETNFHSLPERAVIVHALGPLSNDLKTQLGVALTATRNAFALHKSAIRPGGGPTA